jgi:thiosulfate reductase cytochrome b subunit
MRGFLLLENGVWFFVNKKSGKRYLVSDGALLNKEKDQNRELVVKVVGWSNEHKKFLVSLF